VTRESSYEAPEGEGRSEMSDPESDADFRARLLRIVSEEDRHLVQTLSGKHLDQIGREYDRFRTGVPLKGLEKRRDRS
jgi:hypothetical protein